METQGLYALTIMPPVALAREIDTLRHEFAQRYDCKASLKIPAHITLIPPFSATEGSIKNILQPLNEFTRTQIPFPVTLKDYDVFKDSGTVFINVIQDDLLRLFQKDLETKMQQWFPGVNFNPYPQYHPHVTIAFRDIPREVFEAAVFAWKQKEFFSTFIADSIHIWKHNGQSWDVYASLGLGTMAIYQ